MIVKVLSKHKKYLEAEKVLTKAMTIIPEEADIYYLLSGIYKELKNTANQIKYLKLTISKKLTFSGDIEDVEEELKELEKPQPKVQEQQKTTVNKPETKPTQARPAPRPTQRPAPRPTQRPAPRPNKK